MSQLSWLRMLMKRTIFIAMVLILGFRFIVADNLSLLLGTLQTNKRTGCDRDVMTLKCPHGTTISVQLAHYKQVPPEKKICTADTSVTAEPINTSCILSQAVQIVVEACHKKRQCKFQVSPKTFGSDFCDGVRKYAEVGYKCRPYEFRSKVACQKDIVQLRCNPNSRIAVYSASFGRTEYESIQCPQPQGVPEETCLVSFATETVMQICHGKRNCVVNADDTTFGNPCRHASRLYLKVVYTCVPRKVLKEYMEEGPLGDETPIIGEPGDFDEDFDGYDMDDIFRESAAASPVPGVAGKSIAAGASAADNVSVTTSSTPLAKDHTAAIGVKKVYILKKPPWKDFKKLWSTTVEPDPTNCTVTVISESNSHVIGFLSEWINVFNFLKQNQEKMYLYLIISIASGLLFFLVVIIARLMIQRYRTVKEAKFYAANESTSVPHGFGDENSEIDADITLAATIPSITGAAGKSPPLASSPTATVDILPYNTEMEIVSAPRSLSRLGNSQYYFG